MLTVYGVYGYCNRPVSNRLSVSMVVNKCGSNSYRFQSNVIQHNVYTCKLRRIDVCEDWNFHPTVPSTVMAVYRQTLVSLYLSQPMLYLQSD